MAYKTKVIPLTTTPRKAREAAGKTALKPLAGRKWASLSIEERLRLLAMRLGVIDDKGNIQEE